MADSGRVRADDIDTLLAGYVSGPAAATEATAVALARAASARAVVLVEGVSDQIAVETMARVHGRELASEGVVVVPVGGAHAFVRNLPRFEGMFLAALCDAGEEHVVTDHIERLFVCVEDLEDELIRALGVARVLEVFAAHGDLDRFRTLQRQPAWRGGNEVAQLRRFLAAGAQRKLRYAKLLTETIPVDRTPSPLAELLNAVSVW